MIEPSAWPRTTWAISWASTAASSSSLWAASIAAVVTNTQPPGAANALIVSLSTIVKCQPAIGAGRSPLRVVSIAEAASTPPTAETYAVAPSSRPSASASASW